VTATSLGPGVAEAATVNVVVRDVELDTLIVPTVTPVPSTVMLVAPTTKFIPVKVTGTVEPWTPDEGLMEISDGIGAGASAIFSSAAEPVLTG
jgi:hypothetical protein